jgi:hypothetical protein
MTIHRISGKEIIYVTFKNAGLALLVNNGKLELIDDEYRDKDPTETLNKMRSFVMSECNHHKAQADMLTLAKASAADFAAKDEKLSKRRVDQFLTYVDAYIQNHASSFGLLHPVFEQLTELMLEYNITISQVEDDTTEVLNKEEIDLLIDSIFKTVAGVPDSENKLVELSSLM